MKTLLWSMLIVLGTGVAAPALAQGASFGEPVSVPIAFDIENVNRSRVSCSSDGQPYRLHAEMVAPREVLEGSGAATVTLYLHEYSYDDFWHFRSAPGVDYATELARQGHVSVTLDRLGYDDSPHPDGRATCLGAHADMAHQITARLRDGSYLSPAAPARPFERVVLAGHSVGGIIAEIAAFSFGEIDALMLFAGYHTDFSPRALSDGFRQGQTCATGGEDSGGSPNYAPFSPRDEDFQYYGFAEADPAVVASATALRHLDPCGDVSSLVPASFTAAMHVDEIEVPVLLLWGRDDPVYSSDAGENQAQDFSGNPDVTTAYFERTAHALTLQRSAPQVRDTVATWLVERGLASARQPDPQPAPRGCRLRGRVLTGTGGADVLRGARGRDSMFGLAGTDKLSGRAGRDCLNGGAGADRLVGGAGRDRLLGGRGPDIIVAADGARDIVRCGRGRDRARVDRIDVVRGCELSRRT